MGRIAEAVRRRLKRGATGLKSEMCTAEVCTAGVCTTENDEAKQDTCF